MLELTWLVLPDVLGALELLWVSVDDVPVLVLADGLVVLLNCVLVITGSTVLPP